MTEKMREDSLRAVNTRTNRENAMKVVKTGCKVTASTGNTMATAPEFARDPNAWQRREPGLATLASIEALVELG